MNQGQWIKCGERMPDVGTEVLVCVDGHRNAAWSNRYCLVAYRGTYHWWEERHDDDPLVGVTHWQPLPELPKYCADNEGESL